MGTETARVLALRGVHVVMGVRNMAAGSEAKEAIIKENPIAKVSATELDLSSMASVRKFAVEFKSLDLPLNLLMWDYRTFGLLIADTLSIFFFIIIFFGNSWIVNNWIWLYFSAGPKISYFKIFIGGLFYLKIIWVVEPALRTFSASK